MGEWSNLTQREKANIIRFAIKNGVSDINQIRDTFNVYAKDSLANVDYNMAAAKASGFGSNGNGHYPDTFKKPNHPTFSDESIYHSEATPGGHWSERNSLQRWNFSPSVQQISEPGYIKKAIDYLNNNESEGVTLTDSQGMYPSINGTIYGGVLPEVEVRPSPKYKKSSEAYYDPETDTVFAPDSTGEFYTHERFHARPNMEYLQKIAPYYENLNDSVLTSMGADLPFVNRNGDPGQYYSPEEIGARVAASLGMLKKAGVSKIDNNFVKESRKNETKYGDNYRDLLHMYSDDIITNLLNSYANGGSIHIKPSKRGTFTAAATKHGKSVQAFASQVLAHKENYSPEMVKKANFARNASHWHEDGGSTKVTRVTAVSPNGTWQGYRFPKGSNLTTVKENEYFGLLDAARQMGLNSDDALRYAEGEVTYDAGVLPDITVSPKPKAAAQSFNTFYNTFSPSEGNSLFSTFMDAAANGDNYAKLQRKIGLNREAENYRLLQKAMQEQQSSEIVHVPQYDENGNITYKAMPVGQRGHMELGSSDPLFLGLTFGAGLANGAVSNAATSAGSTASGIKDTYNFLKTPMGKEVAKNVAVDMGLSILGGETVNEASRSLTGYSVGQNIANTTNNIPYIKNIPYGAREFVGDFLNPGYLISGPLRGLSSQASRKLADFSLKDTFDNILNFVKSNSKANKHLTKLKRIYDKSYFGAKQNFEFTRKQLEEKEQELSNAYFNRDKITNDFIEQNTFPISENPGTFITKTIEFKNPITGEIVKEQVPVYKGVSGLEVRPKNVNFGRFLSPLHEADLSVFSYSREGGNRIIGRNQNSTVSSEINKYASQLENLVGDDGVIVGSTSLYRNNIIPGIPGDVEFITTKSRLNSIKNKLGGKRVGDLLGVPGEKITSEKLINSVGDIEIIEETTSGKAVGKTALEFYRIIDPKGYQKILNISKEKGKELYKIPLPISAENLLKTAQADKDIVTAKTILDFLGSGKEKHVERAKSFITTGDTRTVTECLQLLRESLFGEQVKNIQELYPNIKFDNVEANKEFLRYIGFPESYATDQEVVKNIADYFDLSESVTRRSDVLGALKTNQAKWSIRGGGGNYQRASAVGGGKSYGNYNIVMGNTLTTNNNAIHTPADLASAYELSTKMNTPFEKDVVDMLEKLTGRRLENLEAVNKFTKETLGSKNTETLTQTFNDIADILGIRGMRTDETFFGNLSIREDMPQNIIYSEIDSPLEVGGWYNKKAKKTSSDFSFAISKFDEWIPDRYKTNGVYDRDKFNNAVSQIKKETEEAIKQIEKYEHEYNLLHKRLVLLEYLTNHKEDALKAFARVGGIVLSPAALGYTTYKVSSYIPTTPASPEGKRKHEEKGRKRSIFSKDDIKNDTIEHKHSTGGPLYPFSFSHNPYWKTPIVRY